MIALAVRGGANPKFAPTVYPRTRPSEIRRRYAAARKNYFLACKFIRGVSKDRPFTNSRLALPAGPCGLGHALQGFARQFLIAGLYGEVAEGDDPD